MVVLLFEVSPRSKASMDSLHLHYPPSISHIRLSYPNLCISISLNQSSLLSLGIHNPSLRDPPIKSIYQASSFKIHNPSPRDLRKPISHQSNSLKSYCIRFYHPLIPLPILDSFYSAPLLYPPPPLHS